MATFPKDFLWGAATSSHQVEGNNSNNDWWEWEKRTGRELSAQACRHYELFEQDFELARELGHNSHRLSVEWSRIEPEEGKFDEKEIAHYQKVISSLRDKGIEPIVTLHHFTNPLWFSNIGGWLHPRAAVFFARFSEKIVAGLCDKVRFWVTVNEPMVYVTHAYVLGVWPPQKTCVFEASRVARRMAKGHVKAYRAIHRIYKEKGLAAPSVSIAQNVQAFVACGRSLKNSLAVYLRDKYFNLKFIEELIRKRSLDFIGINYYSRQLIDLDSWNPRGILADACNKGHSKLKKNSMGWDIYPDGLLDVLMRFKKYGIALFILENGICTADDGLRWDFIREHLLRVAKAQSQGVKILGYIYWSLLDNFEWDKGFIPRFGLVHVDYITFKRTIRESGRKLAEVCKTGVMNE